MPVETATNFMEKLAKLDLTVSEYNFEKMVLNKDETGLMIKSLIHQRDELLKIVKVLKKNSLQVLNDTDIISTAENETVESITMISNVMEQLLERAGEQASEVRKGSFKLNTLADKIEKSVESISELAKNSMDMEKMQEDGSRSLEELSEEVKRNIRAASNGSGSVDEIIINSNLVEELIGTIREMSEEANYLVRDILTETEKSEENAKASEVVKKVIKLTAKSAEFASKAQDILVNIQKELRIGKKKIDKSRDVFHEINEIMAVSIEAFKNIGKSTNDTMIQIENIAIIIYELNEDKDEVLESFEEISLLTEEVAVSVENVTANIAEQEVAMKSTSERTTELKKVSEALGDVVEKFKI
jgi:methyl-accepting chemotaxis protein